MFLGMYSDCILVATSNPGKLRELRATARLAGSGTTVASLPDFSAWPQVEEDGLTFDANARKKAEHYSRYAAGELVLGDDSGLEVDALHGEPGVRSARYAVLDSPASSLSVDQANNVRLLLKMQAVADHLRAARFVCVVAAARDGLCLATFRGEIVGIILHEPRGANGFGYDPLFYLPELQKTMAELSTEQKASVSHRGRAFRKFLQWYRENGPGARKYSDSA